jgi:hypothetical protein
MADKVTKLRKGATATGQKAQRKEGERKLSSFGEDLSAVMAQDMEQWAKQNTAEEQTAQEDASEHIPMGVSSSSQPPVARMNTGPNEVATKRQRMADPQMGATSSFKQLFADTTGRRLDDLIDQNVGARGTQQEICLTDYLDSANQDGTVQREEVLTESTEKGPPLFVRVSIKAKRLWAAGFGFVEDIDENARYPVGKDLAVIIAINRECDDERYVTADDGILLYTRDFAMYDGQATLVEKDERRYLTVVEAARGVCEVIDVSPVTTFFGEDAEKNSQISDILLGQYNHARSIIRQYEPMIPKVPTPMQTLMAPLMSMNPLMGGPQQVLITQQVPAKEPTVIEDITLEELLRLKAEYAEYVRRSADQPISLQANQVDRQRFVVLVSFLV